MGGQCGNQQPGLLADIFSAPGEITRELLGDLASLLSSRALKSDADVLDMLAMVMIVTGCVVFCTIMSGVKVVYGRYAVNAGPWWGAPVNAKVAWVLQEIPCVVMGTSNMLRGDRECLNSTVNQLLLTLFMMHYANRSLIYPLRLGGGKPTPFLVMLMAFAFCSVNGYMQTRMLTHVHAYEESWFLEPQFGGGVALFITGMWINMQSDEILRNLRKSGETGYRIPKEGLFRYVSGANFLGEIVEWCGFALAAGSFEAAAFAFFTFCNLAPRAYHHHLWYKDKFKDSYPRSRRALIPFLF